MLEIFPTKDTKYCCISLHGLGASGQDLYPLASTIWPDPSVNWLFPDAPMRPITINGGMEMRGWYDVKNTSLLKEKDEQGVKDSAVLIEELIAEQNAKGISNDKIVLFGFSQGGAMALYVGLNLAKSPLAIVALSSYLPLAKSLAKPKKNLVPIFMGAGDIDPIIPASDSKASADLLKKRGHKVTYREYGFLGHAINPIEISDVTYFLELNTLPDSYTSK